MNSKKKLGVIPKDTKLAKKPGDIKDWKDLTANEKKLYASQAEAFAAYLDLPSRRADASAVGRCT